MKEISRRLVLKLIGAGGAGAAAGAAIKQWGKLIPYVVPPEKIRPGQWVEYATVCRECPAGCGMIARCREGRVVKVEGLPEHPVGKGGLCGRGQAAVQGLYDPDRLKRPRKRNERGDWEETGWEEAIEDVGARIRGLTAENAENAEGEMRSTGGAGMGSLAAVLAPRVTRTPRKRQAVEGGEARRGKVVVVSDLQTGTMADVLELLAGNGEGLTAENAENAEKKGAKGSGGRVIYYEAFNYEGIRAANERLFGRAVIPRYRIGDCRMVLSLGADFLETWISPVEFTREFSRMHSPGEDGGIGRLAYVGPRRSMTAGNADDFLMVPPGGEGVVGMAMAEAIVRNGWARVKADGLAEWLKPFAAETVAGTLGAEAGRILGLAKAFAEAKTAVALGGRGFTCETGEHERRGNEEGIPTTQSWGVEGRQEDNWDLAAVAAGVLNWVTGRMGRTVEMRTPHALSGTATRGQVEEALRGLGPEDVLIVHNTNPAYSLPGAGEWMRRAGTVVVLGTMMDETAARADWVLPIDSPLEAWGDYAPYKGLEGLQQPAMRRLWETRPAGDVLLAIRGGTGKGFTRLREATPGQAAESAEKKETGNGFEDRLRGRWMKMHEGWHTSLDFERTWPALLQLGGAWREESVDNRLGEAAIDWASEGPPAALRADVTGMKLPRPAPEDAAVQSTRGGLTARLWVYPSVLLFDGRGANRSWLQEVPDPTSLATWGSWVEMHPETAARIKVADGDVVRLRAAGGAAAEAPVRVTADVAKGTAALATGQGHTELGGNARNRGANAFVLVGVGEGLTRLREATPGQAAENAEHAEGNGNGNPAVPGPCGPCSPFGPFGRVTVWKAGTTSTIAYISREQEQHGREIVRWTRAGGEPGPRAGEFTLPLPESADPKKDLYPPRRYTQHRWAMAADLQKCTGCGACAVACHAENNVPAVGEERVARGGEMAWLKVVPYRDADGRRVGWLPLMCQQCDAAPCEPVCPVYASVHNEEGLNAQVYNRCIGTRYCENNCPYKVRRFNWRDHEWRGPLEMQLNPEVSVRRRGVMEKCTFCIQRIRQAQWAAKRQGRRLRDGEVAPACAQSCPAGALTFGDLLDESSAVSKLTRHDPRRYHVLGHLNTRPAVTYLKRILQAEIGRA